MSIYAISGLPEITDEEQKFLCDNPNTADIVDWVREYAAKATHALRQQLADETQRADGFAETVHALRGIVTGSYESKSAFIGRVREIVGVDPDARFSSLRQQLEEAQAKVDVAEGKLEISLNANHILKQRLDDAEGQEVAAWGIPNSRPTERNPLMQVLLDKTSCQYPELLIPLYLHPALPAIDERVKELQQFLARFDNFDPICGTFNFAPTVEEIHEKAEECRAALAASKGEKS